MVVIYISFRFEWKMAIAALIAVIHDLLVTAGVYSLVGFQVTPDTVIAILTILGYSLYDTVVVFDRVKENTGASAASGRMTYEDVVNLSMNQTLARSINTSLVAILPVLAVLVIGAQILGATTLQYFGLALVIGLMSGAYSSIFIAAPVLAILKEREPRYVNIRRKLAEPRRAVRAAHPAPGRHARRRPRRHRARRRQGGGPGPSGPGRPDRRAAPGRGIAAPARRRDVGADEAAAQPRTGRGGESRSNGGAPRPAPARRPAQPAAAAPVQGKGSSGRPSR